MSVLPQNVSGPWFSDRTGGLGTAALSFLAIGGGAALAFAAISSFVVSLRTGLPAWVVSVICYAAFIGPVYWLHRKFSFRSGAPHRHALPRYAATQTCGLMLAALFSFIAYGVVRLPTPIAAALVMAATSGVNFVVLRAWAFAEPRLG